METPNSVTITTASFFNRSGGVEKVERVTFYIGQHGPFTKDFPDGQDNSMAISMYVQEKASQINALLHRVSS